VKSMEYGASMVMFMAAMATDKSTLDEIMHQRVPRMLRGMSHTYVKIWPDEVISPLASMCTPCQKVRAKPK
jgi:hypothetical protein